MGRLKESIPDYIWDLPEEETNKFWLAKDIEAIVANGKSDNEDLYKFLNLVTPITGPDYFIYVKDEETSTYTNIKFNREDYIDALCCLSEEKYTLFYHIASFKGWIDNDSATAVRCINTNIEAMKQEKNSKCKKQILYAEEMINKYTKKIVELTKAEDYVKKQFSNYS